MADGVIDTPGIYALDAATYLADPCPAPSLSSHIAHILLSRSPLHARHAHPRLGGAVREDSDRFDIGTACHALVLEGAAGVSVVDAKDWRTKPAQDARATARHGGKIPLLADQWDRVQAMAGILRARLKEHRARPVPLRDGHAEITMIWREESVWLRGRADYLHTGGIIDDYKTVERLNPEAWCRSTIYALGYDVQAAFYCRGLRALTGATPRFRFVVQETEPPHDVVVVELGAAAMALAERKADLAISEWAACLLSGTWPGHPTVPLEADLPPWEEARWAGRLAGDPVSPDDGRDLAAQLMGECS
jgi:hypothetical protein